MLLSHFPKPILWGALPLTLLGIYLVSEKIWPLMELGVILAGLGWLGWRFGKPQPDLEPVLPKQVTTDHVQQALSEAADMLGQLAQTPQVSSQLSLLQTRATDLGTDLSRENLHIAVIGSCGVGKTTLIQHLQAYAWPCNCHWLEALLPPQSALPEADLILLLIQADITQPEYDCLQTLKQRGQRTVVVWNKQDQFLPTDRQQVYQHLQQRLEGLVAPADFVTVSAAPMPIQVRQHAVDGTVRQWQEQPLPNLQDLQTRLRDILSQEARQLVVHQTWQQAQSLKTDLQSLLNRSRRQQALPIIERYQWIAGGTAALSPLPALDLIGVGVVTVKMVQEVGAVYQQTLSLDQAQSIGKTLASLMLKLGLVELSSQALTTVLKANSLTYLLGAGLQGVSTAYLTRVAGLTLVEHFQAVSQSHPTVNLPFSKTVSQTFSQTFSQLSLSQQLRHHLKRTIADQAKPEIFKAFAQASVDRLPAGSLPLPQLLTTSEREPVLQERD
jgi:uncharacterized protein